MGMKTVLVVDDEEHIVELISYNLESAGYKVVSTNDLLFLYLVHNIMGDVVCMV